MQADTKSSFEYPNNFTVLRLFAAICVVVSHSFDITGYATLEPLRRLTKEYLVFSDIGLIIFFTISGYLISKSLQNTVNIFSFFARRILRIYPALLVAVLLTIFVIGPIFSNLSTVEYFNNIKTWYYLTTISAFRVQYFLPGLFNNKRYIINSVNASLWSIGLELKLYIGLSFVYFFKNNTLLTKRVLLIVMIGVLAVIVMHANILGREYSYKIVSLIFAFVLGSNIYYQSLKTTHLLAFGLAFLAFGIIQILLNVCIDTAITIRIGISCVAIWLCLQKRFVFVLKNDISYGVYIYAFIVQQVLFQLFQYQMSPQLNIVLTLLITIPLAFLSWKCIEEPTLKLKQQLTKSSVLS